MSLLSFPAAKRLLVGSLFLLFGGSPFLWGYMTMAAAPALQQTRTTAVEGRLPGGRYAQIWLGLAPTDADAQITVFAEWDRPLPTQNGLNFFIFDEQQLRRLDEGRNSFSALALAAGSPRFDLATPDNAAGAGFRATGWATYAIVVLNESPLDATFRLRVTNGFLLDTAGEVTPLAALPADSTPLASTGVVTSPEVASQTAVTPVLTTTEVTGNVSATLPMTSLIPLDSTPTRHPSLVIRSGLGRGARTVDVSGLLDAFTREQFFSVMPIQRGSQILLRLAVDARAEEEGHGGKTLNFWVFDRTGFDQYQANAAPGAVAVTAGKPVFRSAKDERVAGFRALSIQPYIVVIYSTEATPITYTLSIEGARVLE